MTTENQSSNNGLIAQLSLPELIVKILDDRKAGGIVQIDVRGISSITDDVVIATATAAPHLRALTDRLVREIKEMKEVKPRIVDGTPASGWMLIDYSTVMIHLLTQEVRLHYDIEGLWADAPRVETLAKILKLQNKVRIDAEKRIAAAAARTSVRPKTAPKAKATSTTKTKKETATTKKATTTKTVKKTTTPKKTATAKKSTATAKKAPVKKVAAPKKRTTTPKK